jgi:TolA-binding protein
MITRLKITLGVLFALILPMNAHGWQQQLARVSGEVVFTGNLKPEPLNVLLLGDGFHGPMNNTVPVLNGSFMFDSVEPGNYRLVIQDGTGASLYEQSIWVTDMGCFISIEISSRHVHQDTGGTVSLRELQRKIPKPAIKEYKAGKKDIEKGRYATAEKHLLKAIGIYPSFAEAYNDLGLCAARTKDPDKAFAEFQKAHTLDPDLTAANVNLAASYLRLRRYPEAEAAARRALRSDPNCVEAHYTLGMSLAARRTGEQEALTNLQLAGDQFPYAKLAAAQILERRGRISEAVALIKKYLTVAASTANRPAVKAWLARLQH